MKAIKSYPLPFMIVLLAIIVVLSTPVKAQEFDLSDERQDCDISASLAPVSWPKNMRPRSDAFQPIDISIDAQGACDAVLLIRDTQFSMSSNSKSMMGGVSSRSGSHLPGPLEVPVFSSGAVRIYWSPRDYALAGSYLGSAPVSIVDRLSQEELWSGFIDVSMDVPASLSVLPIGGMSALEVDLGDLRSPGSATVSFDVEANSAFSVSTSSASGGLLVHEIAGAAIGVPYDVSISNAGFDSAVSPDRIGEGTGTIDISIVNPGLDIAMAGGYSDTLTVTFRSEM